jgi:putative FmdB family regulatory protein
MPVYEFECRQCSKPFEVFVRSSREMDDVRCPACGSGDPERVLSAFSTASGGQAENHGDAGSSCASRPFK